MLLTPIILIIYTKFNGFRNISYTRNKVEYIDAILSVHLLNELPCSSKFRSIHTLVATITGTI
jgi:hypothetical protein